MKIFVVLNIIIDWRKMMEQVIKELKELKLSTMATYLETQKPLNQNLSFYDQLGILTNAELTKRKNNSIQRLLCLAKLPIVARVEDIEYDDKRGLKKEIFLNIMRLDFLKAHQNIIMTGATGCGKTHLSCAIGNKVCIEKHSVKFIKLPLFLEELQLSHTMGKFSKLTQDLLRIDLLILDDFGITPISESQVHDLLTIIDDRYKIKSTIITSQLPVKSWHKYLGNPTMADAILDRILSQSHRIALNTLNGKSLRWKDSAFSNELDE